MDSKNTLNSEDQDTAGSAERAHDIFLDPALAETVKDDPLFLLLKRWWKHLAVVAGAVVVVIYAKGVFEENRRTELGQAGDTYHSLQSALAEMPALEQAFKKAQDEAAQAKPEAKDEAAKKVQQAQSDLDRSKTRIESVLGTLMETREPYRTLARLNRGVLSVHAGDVQGAQGQISADRWRAIAERNSNDRFFAELEALALARGFLDKDPQVGQGRALLKDLAQNGEFAQVPAATSLALIAGTEAERRDALGVLEELQTRHPEQTDLLTPSIEHLKSELPS